MLWVILPYSASLIAMTGYIATRRHLWFDEILTYYVATLPNAKAIWHALVLALDGQPPVFYLPAHYASRIFGNSEFVLRLPSVIAYWLATVLLYHIVNRRTMPLYGIMAALVPSFTPVFEYSFEARPYALVFMFASVSFLCWQLSKEGRNRNLSILGLALSLAMAVSVHYYALLIAVPLFIGEVSYVYQKRKIDWAVILAICVAALPLAIFVVHIRAIHVLSASHWTRTNFATLFNIYLTLFPKLFILALVGYAAAGIWVGFSRRERTEMSPKLGGVPPYEISAASAYLLLPIACFLLSLYTNALHYRYVLPAVLGAAILISFLSYSFRHKVSCLPWIFILLIVLNLLYTGVRRMRHPDEIQWGAYATYPELFDPAASTVYKTKQDLALGDGPYALVLRYGNLELQRRCFYPVYKNQSDNSVILFHALQAVSRARVDMRDYDILKRDHRSFLLYGPEWWMLPRLVSDGADVRIKALGSGEPLYAVSFK